MMDEYLSFRNATEHKYSEVKFDEEVMSLIEEEEEGKPATEFLPPFYSDIEALCKIYGFMVPGLRIEISLQEMLRICPRKRERSDAYNLLKAELKRKYDVDLIVTSRKKNLKN